MAPQQQPIGSGFLLTTTAEEVAQGIDLTGKNAIVTGGYSGIGIETVRVLINQGAKVFVPARDVERAKKTLADKGVTAATVEYMDLTKAASIEAYAKSFLARNIPLHLLINNAGIMATQTLTLNEKGYENQFATNHLGHFQLTLLLKPALVKANGARIVSVASNGHQYGNVDFADLHFSHGRVYEPIVAYGQSKTSNVLFAVELDKRWQQHKIRAFSVHPGVIVDTNLGTHVPMDYWGKLGLLDSDGKFATLPDNKTVAQGASTNIFAAISPKLEGLGGLYLENNEVALPAGHADNKSGYAGLVSYAANPEAAAKLWAVSEELTGVKDN